MYFNIIYYGKDQYSVQNACRYYFSQTPEEMTLNQAISLGCLLPAPGPYNPLNPDGYFSKAKKLAVNRMLKRELIAPENAALFLDCAFDDKLDIPVVREYEVFFERVYTVCCTKKCSVKRACRYVKRKSQRESKK